jgi:hypothetical protein
MSEKNLKLAMELFNQREKLFETRAKVEEAIEYIGQHPGLTHVQLTVGDTSKRAYSFILPYRLAVVHLQTVTVAWINQLKKVLEECQS